MPCSLTPVGLLVPGHCGTGVLSPLDVTRTTPTTCAFRGSITRLPASLSTLRRRPCGIPTQDSLPAGGQPLPGRIWTCRVPSERFQLCRRLSTSLPPSPGLPWRTTPGTYFGSTHRELGDAEWWVSRYESFVQSLLQTGMKCVSTSTRTIWHAGSFWRSTGPNLRFERCGSGSKRPMTSS
jgi:hypothetical protein